ncbi:dyslexia-associated protein KIAA0319 [Amphiprion ocellaris]|uniref:MANSC domain-containing protein n=1 Tax=Amphiprion ocellaris TaxID=80972 RepID=A0A3Q1B0F9_AMPOC|nr:dyslexia-associated protein KIAA0319 [Amphiprion ocellaris]XP_023125607.2 dyslexia-associated protein KIAA0319 [Amphiprion ocellaris]
MWEKILMLLLFHSVEAVVASQCWQGATFSEAVVSPAVESSGILRVPGVASLPQCVAACCDLPGYDLAWLFEGRCYVLSCQQRENCRPRERPGADSFLAFLRRASPQTLVLQSLVRGEPYGGRWTPLSRSSEAPGDLDALKDLALFDLPQQGFPDPEMLDEEYSEGGQEEKAGSELESLKGRDGFNQSDAEDGPERGLTEGGVAQIRASEGNISRRDEDRTRRPTDPTAAETTTATKSSSTVSTPLKPVSSFTQDPMKTSAPTPSALQLLISTTTKPGRSLTVSPGNPAELTSPTAELTASVAPESTKDMLKLLQSAPEASPTTTHLPVWTVASDPPTASSAASVNPPTTTSPTIAESVSEVRGSNRGPVAVVGPDRTLFLPVSSVLLNGSGSTDDHGVSSYHWEVVSGPPGLKLEDVDQAVATLTGVRVGRYTFKLTVSDQQGATDSASLTVRVQEATSLLPVAHASGSHTLILPNNSLVLRGSVTNGDQSSIHYRWTRYSQSPAAGDVLYESDSQASLYLTNLVEGTYLFQLKVTDAQGRSSLATATVEVQPEPGGGEQVELEMLVSVSQVSVAQRDTVVRQLAALIHVLDSDVQVRALQGHSHLSTVLRFSVRGPSGPLSGSRLVSLLRNQLLREKSDYLLFRVLRVDTVLCLLRCSGRGQCDPVTKQCVCDPFWTENLIRRYLGDGESNCEWRVLYVILTSFVLVVFILSVSWTFICCCKRRRQTKVRKKTKYTILDNMDEQERVELRPKFSIKHRSTEHNSSLMMSESELDSDQDTIFSRDRPVRSRNRISAHATRNGNAFG